jgi:uncharacterized membrane protein
MRLPKPISRGPFAIAGFLGIPLFFSSLMASTLAQEKPNLIVWKGCRELCRAWHDPTTANVASIWLWAVVPSLVLTLIGWLAMRVRFGFYVSCLAAILIALAVVHDIDKWTRHHTARFPLGVDNIPATNNSNVYDPGQWEGMARETAISLSHWTIVIALVAAGVTAGLSLKRRYFGRGPAPASETGAIEGVHAPSATIE